MTGTCLTCRWAKAIDPEEVDADGTDFDLECRRVPPQVTGYDGWYGVYWPLVSGFDWCGEYRPQEQQS